MNDVSRLSRQLAETSNALATAQSRVTQAETKLVETEGERSRLVSELDEARERHRA